MRPKRSLTPSTAQAIPPIQIGGFAFRDFGIEVTGKPIYDHYAAALSFARWARDGSPWWLADLLRYGETRRDWQDRISQAESITGLSEKRLKNMRAVGAIPVERRLEGVEFELHAEVAGLAPSQQTAWLTKALEGHWPLGELRMHLRAHKRRGVIEGQAVLEGQYRVIYADPPWRYGDSGVIAGSAYGRAESAYATMTMADICALPVAAHALPNAVLFLWVPVPLLLENPGPREVIEEWGFCYKSNRAWDKVRGMPSAYAQQITHEHLLIASRGDGHPDEPLPHDPSVFVERRSEEHSEKPASVRKWIEQHWTIGRRLELFAREQHEGWVSYGDDARLWGEEAAAQAKEMR